MKGFFITGTDTGIGKTVTAQALILSLRGRGYRVAGMKPVACGGREDALILAEAAGFAFPLELVNPCCFPAPTAPSIAAPGGMSLEGIKEAFASLAREAMVIVEGIGGWQVPLDERHTVADMAALLDIPVILVVGLRLGCLNHALLTAQSIEASGLPLAGWVANRLAPDMPFEEENIATLSRRIHAPLLGVLPYPLSPCEADLEISVLEGAGW
ncbi:MAG: dethiobiotin synthase [Gammaproteobacteria bacterium]|nr:MAG: dethiobiotin synthase [Gammaproteobacteria bacterium]